MATYKRRIVYLSDAEWELLTARARSASITISAHIRQRLGLAMEPASLPEVAFPEAMARFGASLDELDSIRRSTTFGVPRPAPKPSHK